MCTGTITDFSAFGMALLKENSPLFSSPETREALFSAGYLLSWPVSAVIRRVRHGEKPQGDDKRTLLRTDAGP